METTLQYMDDIKNIRNKVPKLYSIRGDTHYYVLYIKANEY